VGYHKKLQDAAAWLISVRNTDGGWGMSAGQASSIVNTAEAIYILTRSRKHESEIEAALDYITLRLFHSVEKRGARTRYVFFALLAISDHVRQVGPEFVNHCVEWLLGARNKDGGWGHEANDQNSRLFSTCLSLIVLQRVGVQVEHLHAGHNWVSSRNTGTGWSFDDKAPPSPTATALAVLALRKTNSASAEIFTKAKELLLSTTHWGNERENLPGTLWDHATYMWIFPALVCLGVDPYEHTIAEGVRSLNQLACDDGWCEPGGGLSIRGQFWAVFALDSLKESFDPALHVYRIDSERSQTALREPEFVNIAISNRWATIVPRRLYQVVTYLLIVILLGAFTGGYRFLPRWVDFILSVASGLCVYFLVTRRKQHFSKWLLWIVVAVAVILPFLGLVVGLTVKDIFNLFKR
jgi:hypothetical protein